MDIKIKRGEFICVLGDVGSGKTSLIQALIGDLLYMSQDFFQQNQNSDVTDYLVKRAGYIAQSNIRPQSRPIKVLNSNIKGEGAFSYAP